MTHQTITSTTGLYVALPDNVRDELARIKPNMPTVRLENGKELCIITLSGHNLNDWSPQQWANLITAAPEMLEAITMYVKWVRETGLEHNHIPAWDRMLSVLKKATGQ